MLILNVQTPFCFVVKIQKKYEVYPKIYVFKFLTFKVI